MKRFMGWLGVLCFLISVTMAQHSDSRADSVSGLGIEKLGEEKANLLIPLHELQMEGSEKQIQGLKPESADKEDKVYLYEEIKKASNRMSDTGEIMTGGGGYIVLSEKTNDFSGLEETNGFGGNFAFIIVGVGITFVLWVVI